MIGVVGYKHGKTFGSKLNTAQSGDEKGAGFGRGKGGGGQGVILFFLGVLQFPPH
jgi:hypothetical protein